MNTRDSALEPRQQLLATLTQAIPALVLPLPGAARAGLPENASQILAALLQQINELTIQNHQLAVAAGLREEQHTLVHQANQMEILQLRTDLDVAYKAFGTVQQAILERDQKIEHLQSSLSLFNQPLTQPHQRQRRSPAAVQTNLDDASLALHVDSKPVMGLRPAPLILAPRSFKR